MARPRPTTTRQARLITALLDPQYRTVQAAADASGISLRTAARYLADPEFRSALRAAETEAMDAAVRKLVAVAGGAVDVLVDVMDDPDPGHRRHAAKAILDSLLRLRDGLTTEERLSALEARLGNGKH